MADILQKAFVKWIFFIKSWVFFFYHYHLYFTAAVPNDPVDNASLMVDNGLAENR